MSELRIDVRDLTAKVEKLKLPEATQRAIMRRVVAQTARWAQGVAVRTMTSKTELKSEVVKHRVMFDIKNAEYGYARIWFGLFPLSLSWLNPVQNAHGVTAGPASVPGGFMPYSSGPVFKRTGEKRVMKKGRYKGKVREAIQKQYYPIEQFADQILEKLSNQIGERLLLNFEKAYIAELGK
jgi:hypothetical protein